MSLLPALSSTAAMSSRRSYRLLCNLPTVGPSLECSRYPRAPIPPSPQPHRGFHSSQRRRNGSFFNLGGLSTSRECQYLAKERGMPRTDFSPNLELIRSSEVDTQGGPGSRRFSIKEETPIADGKVELLSSVEVGPIKDPIQTHLEAELQKRDEALRDAKLAHDKLILEYDKRSKNETLTVGAAAFILVGMVLLGDFRDKNLPTRRRLDSARIEQGTVAFSQGEQDATTEKAMPGIPLVSANSYELPEEIAVAPSPGILSRLLWASP